MLLRLLLHAEATKVQDSAWHIIPFRLYLRKCPLVDFQMHPERFRLRVCCIISSRSRLEVNTPGWVWYVLKRLSLLWSSYKFLCSSPTILSAFANWVIARSERLEPREFRPKSGNLLLLGSSNFKPPCVLMHLQQRTQLFITEKFITDSLAQVLRDVEFWVISATTEPIASCW